MTCNIYNRGLTGTFQPNTQVKKTRFIRGVSPFSRGMIFTGSCVSLALLSLRENEGLPVVYTVFGSVGLRDPGANSLRCSRICHSRPRWRTPHSFYIGNSDRRFRLSVTQTEALTTRAKYAHKRVAANHFWTI